MHEVERVMVMENHVRSMPPLESPRLVFGLLVVRIDEQALIRRLVDERNLRVSRIRRLINRQRKANGKPPVNGKRCCGSCRPTN